MTSRTGTPLGAVAAPPASAGRAASADAGLAWPAAGLAYAGYPQRDARRDSHLAWRLLAALPLWFQRPTPAAMPAALTQRYETQLAAFAQLEGAARAAAIAETRLALRRGLSPASGGAALALVADTSRRVLGLQPYPTQCLAAWLMLQGRFAEMATGEGKTLAMGLAAAVAALAGVPVHVLTANDYLAERDEAQMAPLYRALGLSSASVVAATPGELRSERYRCLIVHSTAREIGFDYLRDHCQLMGLRDPRQRRAQALAGRALPEPTLPGLHLALLDEADSLLLDEATVPLILAQTGPALPQAELREAWALSAELVPGTDCRLLPGLQRASLSDSALARIAATSRSAGEARRRADWVEAALVARHLIQRDRHYVLSGQEPLLVDEATGRIADGRRWSGALYPMVQIKEGLPPTAPATTAAQITYPRLFSRYLRLGGMSGTLLEARVTLRVWYRATVWRVPLARPDRRRDLGLRLYTRDDARWQAVVASAAAHAAAGRCVLVGVDSIALAEALSARLTRAGVAHQRLDAGHLAERTAAIAPSARAQWVAAEEAALIAGAGRSGNITVATNMAGRGTDIRLDEAARAAGGLHVIATARQRSGRIDRQLLGRAARHGDPGSTEALLSLDDRLLQQVLPAWLRRAARALARGDQLPALPARGLLGLAQAQCAAADALRRHQVSAGDADIDDMLNFAGPAV